jgi:hypothetical protein
MGFLSYIYTSLQATFSLVSLGTRFNIKTKMPRSAGTQLGVSINFNITKIIDMPNLQNCLQNCAIYCGTYAKYNNSSIYGKWLNLSDYSNFEELQ